MIIYYQYQHSINYDEVGLYQIFYLFLYDRLLGSIIRFFDLMRLSILDVRVRFATLIRCLGSLLFGWGFGAVVVAGVRVRLVLLEGGMVG